MTIAAIRQKLHEYIDSASDKKVKAFYTIIEEELNDDYNPLKDPTFVAELDKEYQAYQKDPSTAISWDELKSKTRKRLKSKSK